MPVIRLYPELLDVFRLAGRVAAPAVVLDLYPAFYPFGVAKVTCFELSGEPLKIRW